jgi:hypothetical protein
MFKVVSVAPPIGEPSLYHWLPAPALLVSTIAAVPSHTTTGPTGLIVGVTGIGFTVTTLVPVNNTEQLVTGLVALTVIVVFAVSALVTKLIAPPVPAVVELNEVPPLNNS